METVGVRELKMHLSRYLKRVRAGQHLRVTERGKPIATIAPAEVPVDLEWAHQLIAEGRAAWSGGKPKGVPLAARRRRRRQGPTVSDAVIEDRR